MTDAGQPHTEHGVTPGESNRETVSTLDRAVYALFAGHADDSRHENDRRRFRGLHDDTGFDVLIARTYAGSWVAACVAFVTVVSVGVSLQPAAPGPGWASVGGISLAAALAVKWLTIRAVGAWLRLQVSVRRTAIRRTLPGVARYLHALSSGADDARAMLRRVAETDAHGESARAIRTALNTAELTGSLRRGLERVARDTPARETLSPFLLKFREHAQQGEDSLGEFLRLESRILSHQRERSRDRRADAMELVGELFVVLLVLPALLVIVVTVMSVLAPGLSRPIETPVGVTTGRQLVTYGSAAFVLAAGGVGAGIIAGLRPTHGHGTCRPSGVVTTVVSADRNPASAATVLAGPAAAVGAAAWWGGVAVTDACLGAYVAFAVPVGLVGFRRARIDDAKDGRITDFVHAVSGHVGLGRPLPVAVERVARDVELGPLGPDVTDLAFNLTHNETQTAALERFRERVGTPFAAKTIGLLTGALDAGSDTETVFETLRTEAGRLHHQRRAIRSNMLVYVAIGWTTALLVVGIMLAVETQVVDSFTQLSALSSSGGLALNAGAVQPDRARERFELVTQATAIASGWFAGVADRGRYAALLHSGLLVSIATVAFVGVGG